MNSLNSRKEGTKGAASPTKAIITLFIGTALLVGFMGMSLSFTQTASATTVRDNPSDDRPTPQCDPDETFERGECISLVCPPDTDLEQGSGTSLRCFNEIPKIQGDCPPTHPHSHGTANCYKNPSQPRGENIPRPLVCPPETDLEQGGKCYEEVDPIEERRNPGRGNA